MPEAINFQPLKNSLDALTHDVVGKIDALRADSDGGNANLSVAKMFELQLAMSNLENVSSLSTSVVTAMNSAIKQMASNLSR